MYQMHDILQMIKITKQILEHLLVVRPALETVREQLFSMWFERSVMFPTLHSIIRDVLATNEAAKVQFILEPLAFPQFANYMGRDSLSNFLT